MRPYQQPGLQMSIASAPVADLVLALQRDLRALGYLKGGIDGRFIGRPGTRTDQQHSNDGEDGTMRGVHVGDSLHL